MGWLTEGLFGNDAGGGPQWGWANKLYDASDRLLGRDQMSEVDRAIAHNEARGDPVPEEWYGMSARGVWSFDDEE